MYKTLRSCLKLWLNYGYRKSKKEHQFTSFDFNIFSIICRKKKLSIIYLFWGKNGPTNDKEYGFSHGNVLKM
jgi:hypothetical protein